MSSCSPVERAVASLTRALYGTDLPKQFAVLAGDRSLLQTTIARATTLTSAERISVVVTAHHDAIAREQLAPYPAVELVVQPRNLDTAPGMLLPLVRLVTRSVAENVVFMPLDHHITNTEPVMRAPLRDDERPLGSTDPHRSCAHGPRDRLRMDCPRQAIRTDWCVLETRDGITWAGRSSLGGYRRGCSFLVIVIVIVIVARIERVSAAVALWPLRKALLPARAVLSGSRTSSSFAT
jgi:hypothetical protein